MNAAAVRRAIYAAQGLAPAEVAERDRARLSRVAPCPWCFARPAWPCQVLTADVVWVHPSREDASRALLAATHANAA